MKVAVSFSSHLTAGGTKGPGMMAGGGGSKMGRQREDILRN